MPAFRSVVPFAAIAEHVLSGSADSIPPMSAEFDVGQEVAASLGSRQGAWRFIRRYTESWLTPLTDDDGWTEADLHAAEQRLGLRLPPAIREAYALFGRRQDLTSVQDRLLAPHELEVDMTGEVLVHRVENQSVAVWGVPLAAMDQPDPPVVVARNFEDVGWEPFLERFSVACVEVVLSESLFSAPLQLSDNRELDPAEVALVGQLFARLALPDYPMWALPGGAVRWFVGPEVLLCDFAGTWLWVRARTTLALEAVRVALPGEWLMCPKV
jgi:hypothetical protein